MSETASTRARDFTWSKEPEPHRIRTKAMLKENKEVRKFITKNPFSFIIILTAVGVQVGMAWLLHDKPWWAIVLGAFLVGAFAAHTLFVMIHEVSHNLIFKKRWMNRLAGILANMPHILPSSESFARYHMKHHAFQGVHELDADLAGYWEAKLVGNSTIMKALWLLLYPLFQISRPFRLKEIKLFDTWIVINWLFQIAFDVAIFLWLGPWAILYMFLSLCFGIGLHPLGARWIQEHYLTYPPQETYSYYGMLNTLNFNVGYHNEHHDFPSVPWNHLPKVKKMFPEYYDNLVSHTSYTKLLFKFLFDRKLSLFSRMLRKERGGLKLEDAVEIDQQILSKEPA